MMRAISKWFTKTSIDNQPIKYGGLGVRLHSTITINTSTFLTHDECLVMVDPGVSHIVTDIGITTLMDCTIYRYYLRNASINHQSILQVQDVGGTQQCVWFDQIDEVFPQTPSHWTQVSSDINRDTFSIQDGNVKFDGVFASPINHIELIYNDKCELGQVGSLPEKCLLQSMLYCRPVTNGNADMDIDEYLLVAIEDEERLSLYIGVAVDPNELTII